VRLSEQSLCSISIHYGMRDWCLFVRGASKQWNLLLKVTHRTWGTQVHTHRSPITICLVSQSRSHLPFIDLNCFAVVRALTWVPRTWYSGPTHHALYPRPPARLLEPWLIDVPSKSHQPRGVTLDESHSSWSREEHNPDHVINPTNNETKDWLALCPSEVYTNIKLT